MKVTAQRTYSYYLDPAFTSVPKSEAYYIGKAIQEDSLISLDCYHITTRRKALNAHFTDTMLTTLQGRYTSYYNNGMAEVDGFFDNNIQDDVWQNWDSTGNIHDSIVYQNGKQMVVAKYGYYSNGNLRLYELTDSINDRYAYKSFLRDGSKDIDAGFRGNSGTLKAYDSTGQPLLLTVVDSRKRTTADFPGGKEAYLAFWKKNLDQKPARKLRKPVHIIPVECIINPDGTISEAAVMSNYAKYGKPLEQEALRFVNSFPKMIPATIFGIPIRSFFVVMVTFIDERGF